MDQTNFQAILKQKEDIISALKQELKLLKNTVHICDETKQCSNRSDKSPDECNTDGKKDFTGRENTNFLSNAEIGRYSRQLILPEIGMIGQVKLMNTSVLIVGAGGLGCPAAIYLAAAGIGHLGLVDYDEVELSNLHRQILHKEARLNQNKASSAAEACKSLNSSVRLSTYLVALTSGNASDIISQYDIIVDATDNVATRYLLNDACVLCKKPLVSGSALRFEGQMTVYNHSDGPCYRCLYPEPPPAATVTNCSDGGVLGVVPGIIGSLQACEAIKLALGITSTYAGRLLMFDGLQGSFRTFRIRGRQNSCVVCGSNPTITRLIDYEQFCGASATDKIKERSLLNPESRISVQELLHVQQEETPHVLIDVRQPVEMDICKLKNSINIPLSQIEKLEEINKLKDMIKQINCENVFVVCRLGNDSQLAVQKLRSVLENETLNIRDVKGGLTAWAKYVDTSMPIY